MACGVVTFSLPFCDIPEDVQLCVLSFLSPAEISSFSCTSKRYASLYREDGKIWHAMCDRRWGQKTQIQQWGNGQIAYRLLYKTLNGLENLIGFWRLCGRANPAASSPPLVFFEWGPTFVMGSRVLPTSDDSYQVQKTPFIVMGISPEGRTANFLDLDGNPRSGAALKEFEASSNSIVPVDVNFMGNGHIMLEENRDEGKSPVSKGSSSGDESEDVITVTSPKFIVSEIYTQLANRTSPGGDRRRQRRKEKERLARIKWESEHFIKVADCSPSPTKPLQGLWKGFSEGRNLELYLVKYDEVGGIICRKVEDLSLSRHTPPVFWTPNHAFIRSPLSVEEELILNGRIHTSPPVPEEVHENVVSGLLYMNSSHDLVLPGEGSNGGASLRREGRVWLYENGTFGFGFLQDQFIIDLRRVAQQDGCLADVLDALL